MVSEVLQFIRTPKEYNQKGLAQQFYLSL